MSNPSALLLQLPRHRKVKAHQPDLAKVSVIGIFFLCASRALSRSSSAQALTGGPCKGAQFQRLSRLSSRSKRQNQDSSFQDLRTRKKVAQPLPVQLGLVSKDDWVTLRKQVRTTVWENRRSVAQWGFTAAEILAKVRGYFDVRAEDEITVQQEVKKEEQETTPNALATLAFITAASAVLFRFGGRAAFLNILGLDMGQDPELQNSLQLFLDAVYSVDPLIRFLLVLTAWILAKVLLLDFLAVPLAVADGVLFNGTLEGTFVSCFCATVGSSIAFLVSRNILFDKTRPRMDAAPGLRALEKAVSADGARAVFTLRLAPILPVPIGGYAYIYGLTNISWQEFALGTFLGSAKPYFLDAYIGFCFKEAQRSPGEVAGMNDALLFTTFVATITAGSFASELAVRSFAELTSEVENYDRTVQERRQSGNGVAGSWDPLLLKQTFAESLAFWGIRPSDFPESIDSVLNALNEAQAQDRAIYAEQWITKQRNLNAANPATVGPQLGDVNILQLRPELAEAAEEWSPRPGLEAAQALLLLPVFVEALATYSSPDLWPAAEVTTDPSKSPFSSIDSVWKRSLVRMRRGIRGIFQSFS